VAAARNTVAAGGRLLFASRNCLDDPGCSFRRWWKTNRGSSYSDPIRGRGCWRVTNRPPGGSPSPICSTIRPTTRRCAPPTQPCWRTPARPISSGVWEISFSGAQRRLPFLVRVEVVLPAYTGRSACGSQRCASRRGVCTADEVGAFASGIRKAQVTEYRQWDRNGGAGRTTNGSSRMSGGDVTGVARQDTDPPSEVGRRARWKNCHTRSGFRRSGYCT